MRARMIKLGAAFAALAAFAVGGSQLATAGQKANPPLTPAPATATAPAPTVADSPDAAETGQPDTDTVQHDDQSAPDTAAESSSASESDASDGPGGYADTAANADTQQTGEH